MKFVFDRRPMDWLFAGCLCFSVVVVGCDKPEKKNAVAPPVVVQPPPVSVVPVANPAADLWQSLTNWSLLPPPLEWQTNAPTAEQIARFDDAQSAHVGDAADAAHKFYTQFPADTNVASSRLLELKFLQLAVHYGATNRDAELEAREQDCVQDSSVPEEVRYQVRMDLLGRDLKKTEALGLNMRAALEKAGRLLIREFPNQAGGYQVLADIARTSDTTKARELAQTMADSRGSAVYTNVGVGLLRQLDLLGKPFPLRFDAADGRAINVETLTNKIVLVNFWATWNPASIEGMPRLKQLYERYHTNGLEVVGINFDDDLGRAQKFIKEQELFWPQYLSGRTNKFGVDYSITALPALWLVDRRGNVRDLHGENDLELKIAAMLAE